MFRRFFVGSLVFIAGAVVSCDSHLASAEQKFTAFESSTPIQQAPVMSPNLHAKARTSYLSEQARETLRLRATLMKIRCQAPQKKQTLRLLQDEKPDLSFSVGNTSTGYLVGAKQLTQPSSLYRALPVQYERDLGYATAELIELIEDSAKTMHKLYPGTVLFLGNFAAAEGGDIPYSVSHNSGRDADIAFIFRRIDDNVALFPQNFPKYGASLRSNNILGYRFDSERNAALVKTLITHPKHHVQFIFVAKHLRRAMRNALVNSKTDPDVLARFDVVVQEQAAHADHMHIRVYCAKHEICAGCIDRSLIHEWHDDPVPIREACVKKYSKILRNKKSSTQNLAAAIERLRLLESLETERTRVLSLLAHDNKEVRRAAVESAPYLSEPSEALGKRFAAEQDDDMRCAVLQSLSITRDETALSFLVDALKLPAFKCGAKSSYELSLAAIAFANNKKWVRPLITLRNSAETEHWQHFDRTLRMLTNQSAPNNDWNLWLDTQGEKPRKQWLIEGFNAAGYAVRTLGVQDIPNLLDAVMGEEHISRNARRTLMQISGRNPPCLEWAASDARWYFTRYFKRRYRKFKVDLSDRDERGIRLKK
ncbi:MAG: penicillin-insensitive murein endopeptidase [Bradymonadales bacterium]